MTVEQFEKGQKILGEIQCKEKSKEQIENLRARINQVYPSPFKKCQIKIAESFMSTPVAEIDKQALIVLLDSQANLLELNIEELKVEFESI